MKIAISTESTVDLTKELINENDVKIVPFTVLLGNNAGLDGEITGKDIIEFVNKNNVLPKTSAVNRIQYEEHFSKILKDYDAVVHISLSSKLSSAYENALAVSKELKNVFVIDSQSLSTGIALLVLYAKELASNGLSPEEIVSAVEKRIPFVQASFELNRVDYLYKGGRCSVLSFLGANLLKIRPQILLKDGKMIAGKKYRGNFKRVVENYVSDVLEEYSTPDLSRIFITYTTAEPEIIDYVKEVLLDRGFKEVLVTVAGATITSHCGEDCLGILYINDGE